MINTTVCANPSEHCHCVSCGRPILTGDLMIDGEKGTCCSLNCELASRTNLGSASDTHLPQAAEAGPFQNKE